MAVEQYRVDIETTPAGEGLLLQDINGLLGGTLNVFVRDQENVIPVSLQAIDYLLTHNHEDLDVQSIQCVEVGRSGDRWIFRILAEPMALPDDDPAMTCGEPA